MRNRLLFIIAALGAAAPALAQAPGGATAGAATTALAVGATVYSTGGEAIGTVKAITAEGVVVSTGSNEVTIPPGSFGTGANGPVLAATRADIDNAATAATAQRRASVEKLLIAGTSIRGAAGSVVGTIKARDGDFATVTTPGGDVRLPLAAFVAGSDGLRIGLTADQFDAAIAAAKAAQPPA